jgi:hypothetical protein
VVLALLLIGAGVAFALTRPKNDVAATPTPPATAPADATTTTKVEDTTTKKKTTTTEEKTTTTKRSTSTSKLATTTTAGGSSSTDALIRQKFIENMMTQQGYTEAEASCVADKIEANFGWAKVGGGDMTPAETQQLGQMVLECKSTA